MKNGVCRATLCSTLQHNTWQHSISALAAKLHLRKSHSHITWQTHTACASTSTQGMHGHSQPHGHNHNTDQGTAKRRCAQKGPTDTPVATCNRCSFQLAKPLKTGAPKRVTCTTGGGLGKRRALATKSEVLSVADMMMSLRGKTASGEVGS